MKHILASILFALALEATQAQMFDAFLYEQEKVIAAELNLIASVQDDYVRGQANQRLLAAWTAALAKPNSFDYDFASATLSKLRSDDNRLRIITWNLPHEDGTFSYFGFIQYIDQSEQYHFFTLNDQSEKIEKPEKQRLLPDLWYGALYYQIVELHDRDQTYYTLLGWDGFDALSTHKVIDVLYFPTPDRPTFGANIFDLNGRTYKRLIFRFADRANFTLRYEERQKMIVFDHLAPIRPEYSGMPEYYGPDMTQDALRAHKGRWELDTLVDVRNAKETAPRRELKYSSY